MELVLHLWNFTPLDDPAGIAQHVRATAQAADQGGFATITLMDHWFQMEHAAPRTEPMLEGYTGLGYLAGVTERIQLGLLVTGVAYRHPGLLAKTVATLDVLSQGRAMLGIGAAWYEREHQALGVPYPPTGERFERLEEALQICGGSGEKKTLRLVTQYADACNLFATDLDTIVHKKQVLEGHCRDVGRDPAEIAITVRASGGKPDPLEGADGFLRRLEAYARLGVTKTWVGIPLHHDDPEGWTARVAERIVPRAQAISASAG